VWRYVLVLLCWFKIAINALAHRGVEEKLLVRHTKYTSARSNDNIEDCETWQRGSLRAARSFRASVRIPVSEKIKTPHVVSGFTQ